MTGRLRTVLHGLFVPDRTMLIDDERFTLDELVILLAVSEGCVKNIPHAVLDNAIADNPNLTEATEIINVLMRRGLIVQSTAPDPHLPPSSGPPDTEEQ